MATVRRAWHTMTTAQLVTTTGAVVSLGIWGRFMTAATATIARPTRSSGARRPASRSSMLSTGSAGTVHVDRCTADWRRPGSYWACRRPAGHAGQHRMQFDARA